MRKYFLAISIVITLFSYSKDSFSVRKIGFSAVNIAGFSYITYHSSQRFFKDYPYSKFHFKNDIQSWKGMDKLMHAYLTHKYFYVNYRIYKWAGYSKKKAIGLSTAGALILSTTKEWIDGHIDIGGFSLYDIGFNISGISLTALQEIYFNKQIFKLKYSYQNTIYPTYNSGDLGVSQFSKMYRDYNGITFWLSAPLSLNNASRSTWKKVVGIALGYGVDGLLSAETNTSIEYQNRLEPITRSNEFYFAPDIHFEMIPTNNFWLKKLFYLLDHFKFPTPTLQFGTQGLRFHPIYF